MDKKILTHRFAKGLSLLFIALLLAGLALGLTPVMVANAATFDVTTTVDGVPGSLRQAIIAANANPGPDTINLPAGIYTLTIAGAGEDAAATGDLDITDDLTINGADQATTIIDGGELDRVFHIHPGSTVEISGVTIRNGVAFENFSGGGGILNAGVLTLTNSTVSGNSAPSAVGWGGGIANFDTMTIVNSTVIGNTANDTGGGIRNSGITVLTESMVSDNTASNFGGGIFTLGAVTLMDSTVSGNSAPCGGGVDIHDSTASLTATRSTFDNNTAVNGSGGGILNTGLLTLSDSTIRDNTAFVGEGGGTLTVTNSTISGNTAGGGGGGIKGERGTVTLKNSIIANSPSGGDCIGSITSAGCNLDSDGTCGFGGPGDLSNTDPLLGPLQDNGGPTETHALLPGSPAIDTVSEDCGCTVTEDQRGAPRPIDGDDDSTALCDIGAYEKQPLVGGIVEPVTLSEPGTASDQAPGSATGHTAVALWLGLAFILAIGGGVLALRRRRAH